MKRKAKELQAARISAGKGRSLLSGFSGGTGGAGSVNGSGGGYGRQGNNPTVGDTATPLDNSPPKSFTAK